MADEKKQYPRSKLEIIEAAKEPRDFGDRGGQVINFRAKVIEPAGNPWLGQTISFGCFRKDLFDTIKVAEVGVVLDCDFETKPYQTQEGERLNFNIIQVYVDGQPVVSRGQKGNYGRSPESIRLEYILKAEMERIKQVSLEGQNALSNLIILLTSSVKPNPEIGGMTALALDIIKAKLEKYQSPDVVELLQHLPHIAAEPLPVTRRATTEPLKEESSGKLSDEVKPQDDMVWFADSTKQIKWSESTIKSWLKSKANYAGFSFEGTIEDIIRRMNTEQRGFLFKEVQDRLDMA